MPQRPPSLRPCGCVKRSDEACPHRTIQRREQDRRRPTAQARGYNSKWQKARDAFLSLFPRCVRCGSEATVVDHIVPHRGDSKLFWSRSNWQSLCQNCHRSWKQSLERKNFQ